MKAITTAAVLALFATGGIAMAEGTAPAAPAATTPAATTAPVDAHKDMSAPAAPAVDAKKAKKGKKHKM